MYTLSSTPQLEENILRDRKPKDIVVTEKPIPWTPEGAPMLYIRRMTPSECERLQGFPQGWTQGLSYDHASQALADSFPPAAAYVLAKGLREALRK